MPGGRRNPTRQLVSPHLELEADIELAEIMQKREVRQASRSRVRKLVRPCRLHEPRPQHRIAEQGFEARGDVSAMMFEAVKTT